MDSPTPVPAPPTRNPRRPRRGLNPAALLAVVNGVLVGVGSLYLSTHSVLITLIAAIAAVALAGLTLVFG
jgi:hypothetical protein